LYSRFLLPAAVHAKEVTDVQFDVRVDQKKRPEDQDLLIWDEARDFISDATANHLRDSRVTEFYLAVRRYFEETCRYLLLKLPLHDPLLKHAAILDPLKQMTVSLSDLDYFLQLFPSLVPGNVSNNVIKKEFAAYQQADISNCIQDRVDHTWVKVSKDFPQFKNLCHVMLGICTIPHSSAACERVFSCVRKTATAQRSTLSAETMEVVLVLKSETKDKHYTDEEPDRIKSAYSETQQQYKKKKN
jgi:hypothetical protein